MAAGWKISDKKLKQFTLHGYTFKAQQLGFGGHTAGTGKPTGPVAGDDPVARDYNRDWICAAGRANRLRRTAEFFGNIPIGACLASRYFAHGLPDGFLEIRSGRCQGQIKTGSLAIKVVIELGASLLKYSFINFV